MDRLPGYLSTQRVFGRPFFRRIPGTTEPPFDRPTGWRAVLKEGFLTFFAPKCIDNRNESLSLQPDRRRDAGVVDRAALEMRCTGNCTGGSNPSLSATNAENQQIAKQTPSFTPKNVKSGVFVLFKIIQPLHNKRVAILKESDEKRLIFIYPFTLIFQDFTSS